MLCRSVLACLFCLVSALAASAAPLPAAQVPDALKPWVDWVLWDRKDHACASDHDSPEQRRCVWPTRLALNLDGQGGRFVLEVRLDAADWALLPGGAEHWPLDITVDGAASATASRDGRPGLWLAPGVHAIAGRFIWARLPESLDIPEHTGLIALTVDHQPVPLPVVNDQRQLWIHHEADESAAADTADSLALKVYRRVADGVPVRVTTRMDLDVSGRSREILLQGALLADAVPLRVASELPARLEPDGRLRVQVRPGRWPIEVEARFPGEVAALALAENPGPWPREEVWSFAAQPEVRLVEIQGVPPVDPRQTELPEDWRGLPAYRLEPGATLGFKQLRRGDPDPEPDSLTLRRRIWLDFDGRGYTVHDRIGGRMTREWRLNAGPNLALGRVSSDGEPQSITRDIQTGGIGVEVRRGALDLSADSRMDGRRQFAAAGWNQDFRQLGVELNLPPGWKLFTAFGVDEAPGTWTGAWTLLDLFVVLITALAVGRLWHWRWAAFVLLGLSLLWQEADAPRYIWLHLLAAAALLRVLPAGRVRGAVLGYRNLTLLVLALLAVPFMADQIRFGLYPQLQQPWSVQTPVASAESESPAPAAPPAEAGDMARSLPKRQSLALAKPALIPEATRDIDPDAITQTGPGLPRWAWTRIGLAWNGPVLRGQEVGLVLLPPAANLLLNLLRVVVLLGMAWRLAGGPPNFRGFRPGGAAPLLCLPLLIFLPDAKADFPGPELLDSLRARLLAPPDCQPACAEIPQLTLRTGPATLTETLDIHTLARVAVPLPAQLGLWLPSTAEVDGKSADSLFRDDDGVLWLALVPGRHRVVLSGPLPSREQVTIPLPLPPRRVEVGGGPWRVEGLRENGVPEVQLQLLRPADTGPADHLPTLEPRPLPPFLEVQRTLRIGLDWRVDSVARRLSPADGAVAVEIPLLPGEAVVTGGLQVRDGKLAINLPPGQGEVAWSSVLDKQPTLTLQAPQTSAWSEIWQADIGPLWHLRPEGVVAIHQQNPAGRWLPEWRPWPGESVTLHLTRPTGVPGNTLTIDSAELAVTPGTRATDASLTLAIRASQGGQHGLTLPDGATLQSVSIDGATQPVRQQGRAVSLPIHPGTQTATLAWRSDTGIATRWAVPAVDVGAASVNTALRVELGRDRWVWLLGGGPVLGPAVLFWGVLVLVLLLAFGLGRLAPTPLRTWQWALLLLGLSQVSVFGGVLVVGWLLALAFRERAGQGFDRVRFNLLQAGLALLTLAALAALLQAVEHGLLGLPAMQVAGNGSDAYHLAWYQDRSPAVLPRPWIVSVPLWAYRLAMLAWALWLAYSLLDWLRWGYGAYAAGGLWRARSPIPPHPEEPTA